jgi:hypothetical protein
MLIYGQVWLQKWGWGGLAYRHCRVDEAVAACEVHQGDAARMTGQGRDIRYVTRNYEELVTAGIMVGDRFINNS